MPDHQDISNTPILIPNMKGTTITREQKGLRQFSSILPPSLYLHLPLLIPILIQFFLCLWPHAFYFLLLSVSMTLRLKVAASCLPSPPTLFSLLSEFAFPLRFLLGQLLPPQLPPSSLLNEQLRQPPVLSQLFGPYDPFLSFVLHQLCCPFQSSSTFKSRPISTAVAQPDEYSCHLVLARPARPPP